MPTKWASILGCFESYLEKGRDKMKLIIKSNSGEIVSLELNDVDTFEDLMDKVEREVGLTLDLNEIAIKGKKITESQRIVDYFGYLPQTELAQRNIFCVVPGCNNTKYRNPDKVYFEFPTAEIRCHQWVIYCQRLAAGAGKNRLHITSESTICSDHFRSDQFVKNTNTLLKRTAVPCMKMFMEKSRELQDKYSEGHGLGSYNYSQLTGQTFNCLENEYVRLCRLCASPSDVFYQIFDNFGKEMNIAEKIKLCLPLKIEITDVLPKQICKSCFQKLNDLFELADQCSITQNNMINANQIDFSPISLLFESDVCIEEKQCFKTVCPMCLDGKLKVCSRQDFYLNTNEEITDNEANSTSNHNHFNVLNEDIPFDMKESDSSSIDSGPQTRMEVSSLCEPILTVKVEDKSLKSEDDEQIYGPFSGLGSPPSPLMFDEMNNNNHKEILIPESDLFSMAPKDQKLCSQQLGKNVNSSGIVFICRICAKEFFKSIELLNHSYDHSCQNFYQCCACVIFYHTKIDLQQHLQQHLSYKDIINYCSSCHQGFNCDLSSLGSHLCVKENNTCYLCPKNTDSPTCQQSKFFENSSKSLRYLCNNVLEDKINLQKHFLYSNPSSNKTNCCKECGKVFKSEASMKYHQRTHQNNDGVKPYCCNRCGKCFIRKSMLINHMTSSHPSTIAETSCITCQYCNESFPIIAAAVAHMDNVHKLESQEKGTLTFDKQTVKKVFICEYCERCFVEDSILNKHRERHPTEAPYECKYCFETFISYEELYLHKNSHVNEKERAEYLVDFTLTKTYLCEYCERCFLNQTKYLEHLSIHFGSEPYKCRYCPILKFQTLIDAMEHREKHEKVLPEIDEYNSIRPYDCHYCSKTFAIEDALIKHIRMHTGEKPFICDQCGKGFSQSSGLYTHQKVHSNERPYSCSVCPRTFKIKGDRDVHVRKHSGERPYKCEYCNKAFMTQHVYSQHKKIHTGERPYKCDVCKISFRRSHVLTVHKRIHTGEKPHVCHFCKKSYRQKGDLLKHCKIQHGMLNCKQILSPFQLQQNVFSVMEQLV